jgi:uncharacterized membrane protein
MASPPRNTVKQWPVKTPGHGAGTQALRLGEAKQARLSEPGPHYNDRMLALRFVAALSLVVWLGGVVAIGSVVAPAAFAVLPVSDAASLVGETLRRFYFVSYAAGVVLLLSLTLMALLGPRPHAFAVRVAAVSVMLAATLASGAWIDRRIAALRAEIGVAVGSLPQDDPRRVRFGRLHGLSTTLMAVVAAGGLLLLYLETRDPR